MIAAALRQLVGCGGGGSLGDGGFAINCEQLTMPGGPLCGSAKSADSGALCSSVELTIKGSRNVRTYSVER